MNPFDWSLITAITAFARHSYTFDTGVLLLSVTDTVKGAVILSLLYWAWGKHENDDRRRRILIMTVIGAFAAALFTRALSLSLPIRLRPNHQDLPIAWPYGVTPYDLHNLNSMPSDHASLFGAISMGLLLADLPIGLASWVYTLIFICLPRIYVGNHHPTDILAGLAGGCFVIWILTRAAVLDRVAAPVQRLMKRYPGPSCALLFFLTFEIATLFEGSRSAASYLADIVRNVLQRV